MDVSWKVYVALSLMMFFQFAVWGAWAPVLAARLLGPLKMSGKQTGWIYTTLPIACIISPLVAGHVADGHAVQAHGIPADESRCGVEARLVREFLAEEVGAAADHEDAGHETSETQDDSGKHQASIPIDI